MGLFRLLIVCESLKQKSIRIDGMARSATGRNPYDRGKEVGNGKWPGVGYGSCYSDTLQGEVENV